MQYAHPNKTCQVLSLWNAPYEPTWRYQEALLNHIVQIKLRNRQQVKPEPTPNFLIFCEHSHVYTLGKSGKKEHLLLTEEQCAEQGIEFFPIDRGGDITYHGLGQLVAYPIFDLENFSTDLHVFLRNIEEVIIRTIGHYGIEGGRIAGLTGVWVDTDKPNPRKIAAIGIRCSRWVTMHGLALNVNTNLNYFKNIIPCGISDKGVTSIQQELNKTVNFQEVMNIMQDEFLAVFGLSYSEDHFPILPNFVI